MTNPVNAVSTEVRDAVKERYGKIAQSVAVTGSQGGGCCGPLGEIEAMPLPDASVDVIISNCVVNLSPDKDAVLAEAHRVLRPGGKLAISDTVALQPFSADLAASMAAWLACVAGALDVDTYVAKLRAAGFTDVHISDVTPTDFGFNLGVADGAATVATDLPVGDLRQWLASAVITAHKRD